MDPTTQVLQAALAFADALITHGESVHQDVQGLVTFSQTSLENALKGHTHLLIDRRDQLGAALDTLTPVKA